MEKSTTAFESLYHVKMQATSKFLKLVASMSYGDPGSESDSVD
jgi:hypothetical protein